MPKTATMIRSIQNPPMCQDDINRFRQNLSKHLSGNFTEEEKITLDRRKAQAKANAKRIISNCGGKNPILGY